MISSTQSGPVGGRAAFDGWHGSMKPEERRTIMIRRSASAKTLLLDPVLRLTGGSMEAAPR
jgi:hypothetical protein